MAQAIVGLAIEAGKQIGEIFNQILEFQARQDELFIESQMSGTVPPYIEYLMSEKFPNYGLTDMHKFPKEWKEKILGAGILQGQLPGEIRKKLRDLITRTWKSWREKIAKWKKDAPDYQWDTMMQALDEDRLPTGYSFEVLEALGFGFKEKVAALKKRFAERKTKLYNTLADILDNLAKGIDNFLKDPALLTDAERVALRDIKFKTSDLRDYAKQAREQKITETGVKTLLEMMDSKFKNFEANLSTSEKNQEIANQIVAANKERNAKINEFIQAYNVKI